MYMVMCQNASLHLRKGDSIMIDGIPILTI